MEKPKVEINDVIKIGNHSNAPKAQVIYIYSEEESNKGPFGDLEVIYFQNGIKYIKEDVIWGEDGWEFKNSGPSGCYVDIKDYPELKINKI